MQNTNIRIHTKVRSSKAMDLVNLECLCQDEYNLKYRKYSYLIKFIMNEKVRIYSYFKIDLNVFET